MVVDKCEDVRRIKKRHLLCCCCFGFVCGIGAIIGGAVYLGLKLRDTLNDQGNLNGTMSETESRTACPKNWLMYNDNCYRFGNYTLPWRNAQSTCVQASAHLVDVFNKNEAEWLSNTAKDHKYNDIWIGGRRNSTTLRYYWHNNGQLKGVHFTYWTQGYISDPEKDCIQMTKKENFKWTTALCSEQKQFICRRRLP